MGRLDRYILSQLMVIFGFFSLILILIYWINRAVILFDQLIADGHNAAVFLEFSVLSLPNIIRIVLPLAGFAASVYVTNRLSSDSELVVVQATGYSAFRLARPFLVFGAVVALLVWTLTHFLVPVSTRLLAERSAEIAQNVGARLLTEGQFLDPADGVTFYIREITPEGELRDVYLTDTSDPESQMTYTANVAYLVRTERGPQLVMRDGMAQTLRRDSGSLIVTTFDDFAYDVAGFVNRPGDHNRHPREVPSRELLDPTEALQTETGASPEGLIAVVHDRFGQGLIAVIGALLGYATLLSGGFSRFGVWRQIIAAVGLIVVIKTVETAGANIALRDPTLWPAIYLPTLVGIAIIWGLLAAASRPALFSRRDAAVREAAP